MKSTAESSDKGLTYELQDGNSITVDAERPLGYDTEMKSTAESSDKRLTYELQDGNSITVDAERPLGYDTEMKSTAESSDKRLTYELQDGNSITVDAERPLGYDTEMKSTAESSDKGLTYEFQDGNSITVDAERLRCTKAWFQPSFIFNQAYETNDTYFQRIMKDIELSGGTTLFQGIEERMTKELTAMAPSTMKSSDGSSRVF